MRSSKNHHRLLHKYCFSDRDG